MGQGMKRKRGKDQEKEQPGRVRGRLLRTSNKKQKGAVSYKKNLTYLGELRGLAERRKARRLHRGDQGMVFG